MEPSPPQMKPTRHSALDLPDVEDSPDPAAPRLSMAVDDMFDEDSFHDAPPRRSSLPDLPDDVDGETMQSLEFGRRALSEDARFAFAGRHSERFADLSELGPVHEEVEIDGTFVNHGLQDANIEGAWNEGDTTTQMRAFTAGTDGRLSDADLGVFGENEEDADEPTFRFLIPERIRALTQDGEPKQGGELNDGNGVSQTLEDPTQAPADDLDNEDSAQDTGMAGWRSDSVEEDDADLTAYREEQSAVDRSLQSATPGRAEAAATAGTRRVKELRISQRGLEYPSFPAAAVKKLGLSVMKSGGGKAKLSKDTLAALVRTTDDFFEQIGIDLAAYAQHGARKVIEESDVIALMKRTRKISDGNTLFSLAQKMLPRELVQQLRMAPPVRLKGLKRKRLGAVQEADEDS